MEIYLKTVTAIACILLRRPRYDCESPGRALDCAIGIDEKNPYNTTTGEVWSFTTMHDPNLVGWWRFDEMSGEIAYD